MRFGEANAILAGDALQTLAFKLVAEDENLSAEKRVLSIAEIARASGTPQAWSPGQGCDLEAESREVSAGGVGTNPSLENWRVDQRCGKVRSHHRRCLRNRTSHRN